MASLHQAAAGRRCSGRSPNGHLFVGGFGHQSLNPRL